IENEKAARLKREKEETHRLRLEAEKAERRRIERIAQREAARERRVRRITAMKSTLGGTLSYAKQFARRMTTLNRVPTSLKVTILAVILIATIGLLGWLISRTAFLSGLHRSSNVMQ